MRPSRARHHGLCKHCRKRKRLLPGDPRLCRECVASAAAWFHGERSVLDNLDVIQASPRLFLRHLIGEALWKKAEEDSVQDAIASCPDLAVTALAAELVAYCKEEAPAVEVDRRRDAARLNVVSIRRARQLEATQGLRWRR